MIKIRNRFSIIIALICAGITFFTQAVDVRHIFIIEDNRYTLYLLMRFLAFFISAGIYYVLIRNFYNAFSRNEKEKTESYFFIFYLLVNVSVLLLTWPGIYKGDEFYIIPHIVYNLSIAWTQSFYTSVFYQISLMIFPFLAGITFIQLVIITILATDIFKIVRAKLSNKKVVWFIFFPFILLPVIDNNLFTLRTSIIAWIFADLIVSIFVLINNNSKIKQLKSEQILFGGGYHVKIITEVCFAAAWRTEYCYLIIMIIFLYVFLLIGHKVSGKKFCVLCVEVIAVYILFSSPVRIAEPQNNYALTMIITPLSEVIKKNYDDFTSNKKLERDYEIINSITPVKMVSDTTSGINVPSVYWGLELVEKEQKTKWIKAAVHVCAYYWKDFIRNRLFLYKYTNGMVPNVINHTGSEDAEIVLDLKYGGGYFFDEYFKYTDLPLGDSIRRKTISTIACRNIEKYNMTNKIYAFLYNSLIPLVLLAALTTVFIFKKKWVEVMINVCVISIALILFILVPAHFWMYYMPFFLTSYLLCLLYLLFWIDQRNFKLNENL